MDKFKEYKYIILITLLILGTTFYWFSWRPTEIRKECSQKEMSYVYYPTSESNRPVGDAVDLNYEYLKCVRYYGLPD
jgi:hypothetical protein